MSFLQSLSRTTLTQQNFPWPFWITSFRTPNLFLSPPKLEVEVTSNRHLETRIFHLEKIRNERPKHFPWFLSSMESPDNSQFLYYGRFIVCAECRLRFHDDHNATHSEDSNFPKFVSTLELGRFPNYHILQQIVLLKIQRTFKFQRYSKSVFLC